MKNIFHPTPPSPSAPVSPEAFEKTAVRVTMITIIANALLSLFKLLAGLFAHSGAMISDAIHSASDVLSSVIVIIGVKMSVKESDDKHPYGHERFECVAAIVLAVILLICGLFIGLASIEKLGSGNVREVVIPGMPALIAAVISILSKEAMYWYTRFYAVTLSSGALMADAWHHRSDALSSLGALIGIAGARMGYPMLDTIASLVICVFIVKAAYDIFTDAIGEMIDSSCSPETELQIMNCAIGQEGVICVDSLQTRMFGNKVYAEIEICTDGNITLSQSYEIAQNVHNAIEEKIVIVKHVTVCVKPYQSETKPDEIHTLIE